MAKNGRMPAALEYAWDFVARSMQTRSGSVLPAMCFHHRPDAAMAPPAPGPPHPCNAQ